MIGTIIGLVLLMALLGVMFYCARMLLPLVSPILRVLIILLVAIMARALRELDQGQEPGPPELCARRADRAGQAAAE